MPFDCNKYRELFPVAGARLATFFGHGHLRFIPTILFFKDGCKGVDAIASSDVGFVRINLLA